MIQVCLLTCGRHDLTQRTVETFAAHNAGRDDLLLWHIDAGPAGDDQDRSCAIAAGRGFTTIWAPHERDGQIESFRWFMAAAHSRPRPFVLWLENDWESVHPVPTERFLTAFETVDQWRLYGHRKIASGGPRSRAGTKNLGTGEAIDWRPSQAVKGWEITERAHWGAGGTIVRRHALTRFRWDQRLKDVIVAAFDLRTMRPTKNIMNHIGLETTPGFFG